MLCTKATIQSQLHAKLKKFPRYWDLIILLFIFTPCPPTPHRELSCGMYLKDNFYIFSLTIARTSLYTVFFPLFTAMLLNVLVPFTCRKVLPFNCSTLFYYILN